MKQGEYMDLRVQKTREAIQGTFEEMIMKMPPEKISVKELTEKARINRKTFYLHYTSIEALFEATLQKIADGYEEEMRKLPDPLTLEDVNRAFFTYFQAQPPYVERILCAPAYYMFSLQLFRSIFESNRRRNNPYGNLSVEKQNIIDTFLISSSLDMYRQWVRDKKALTLAEIIALSSELICDGAHSLVLPKVIPGIAPSNS